MELSDYLLTIPNPDGSVWDVDSWMQSLSDDSAVVNLLWEVLSALIRPFVRWNKSIWLYAESGNNGKSTLVEMMRAICGSACTSIPISQFGETFGLEGILGKTAILVDEEDPCPPPKSISKFKAAVTNDILQVNGKYKKIVNYRFHGITVICINNLPNLSIDRSGALWRRLLMIPFTSCFTGAENKKIKDDYVSRPDVLEYVIFKALNINCYEFDIPDPCNIALDDYMNNTQNDPLIPFLYEFLPKFVWDLVPFGFLYDLYVAWLQQTHQDIRIETKKVIIERVRVFVSSHNTGWIDTNIGVPKRVSNMMDRAENLVDQFGLTTWADPSMRSDMYHGLIRQGTAPEESQDEE